MRIRRELDEKISQSLSETIGAPASAIVKEAKDARFGDYQANGVMAAAKQVKANPRDLAAKVVSALALSDLCATPEVAGPGFINLKLSDSFLSRQLAAMAADERLAVETVSRPRTVVVDFSSPNVAKPLHVGHLRSTILGDALVRVLKFLGHRVIGDNHVGDWGTQFGMLIVGFRRWGDEQALRDRPTDELERVYRLTNEAAKQDEAVAEAARAELARLQGGDPDNRALWERFVAATRQEVEAIYRRLDVHFDEWRGESAYHDDLGPLVVRLLADGVAREDEGAVLVYFGEQDDPELADKPFMVRKSDGAFNYATTDLATIVYRDAAHQAEEMAYVVDKRQSLHFKQLFSTARRLGYRQRLAHVGFGTILGADGRPIKTREGGAVRLADLLAEAVRRAREIIEEKNPELTGAEKDEAAEIVGLGAVKYADLSQNRTSDYRFDWSKLLAFEGNTAPYLQYVHARVRSIFRKLGEPDWRLPAGAALTVAHPSERGLAQVLVRFADVVHDVPEDYYPHILSDHLFNLAQAYNVFYRDCPVLTAAGAEQLTRLTLCEVTARQLRLGLDLLGIRVPERM